MIQSRVQVAITRNRTDRLVQQVAQRMGSSWNIDGTPATTSQVIYQPEDIELLARPAQWIIFTSPRTINILAPHIDRICAGKNVCVVGARTAQELSRYAITPTVVSSGSAASIVEDFRSISPHDSGMLPVVHYPCSALSASTIPDGLGRAGWLVHRVHIYTTIPLRPLPALYSPDLHYVVALAGSAVRTLSGFLTDNPHVGLVTFGAPSTRVAHSLNLRVITSAHTPDAHGISDALHYAYNIHGDSSHLPDV